MALRDSIKIGFFANLDPAHGFGPCIGDLATKMPGVRVDHVDVHSVPEEVATDANIEGWLDILAGIPIQTIWAGFLGETYQSIAHTHGYGLVPVESRNANLAELEYVRTSCCGTHQVASVAFASSCIARAAITAVGGSTWQAAAATHVVRPRAMRHLGRARL